MAQVMVFNPHRRRPTIDDLLDELDEIKQLSMEVARREGHQPSVAVQCVVAKGKIMGMFVTRLQVEKTASFESMTYDQLVLHVQSELGDAAANKLKSFQRQLERKRESQNGE